MNISLKPNKLYFKKHIYFILLLSILVDIFFIPFCLFIQAENNTGFLVFICGCVGWVVLCAFILFFSKLWINNLTYLIKEQNIRIYKGIFTKVEQNIPNSKVTDFILHRDLLDRFLGLGSIKVQTAGGSGEMGYEGILNGILDYEEVHENLRNNLLASSSSLNEDYKKNSLSSDKVLEDILSELKDINKNLNK